MLLNDWDTRLDSAGARGKTICLSVHGRRRIDGRRGGKQDRLRDAHALLMMQERLVAALLIGAVLVDVDNALVARNVDNRLRRCGNGLGIRRRMRAPPCHNRGRGRKHLPSSRSISHSALILSLTYPSAI